MSDAKQIFLSYSWADREIVEKIDKDFQGFGIRLIRDAREVSYATSIHKFMKGVRTADFVLMLISDAYLKSPYCLYEVLEFIKDTTFRDRLLPLIIGDFSLLSPRNQLDYVKYWADEYQDFKERMVGIDAIQGIGLAEHLRMLLNISTTVGEFLTSLADMLAFRVGDLNTDAYTNVFRRIGLNPARIILNELEMCEDDLYSCRYTAKVPTIIEKRLQLLKRLAETGYLEPVLDRRFCYTVGLAVTDYVDIAIEYHSSTGITGLTNADISGLVNADALCLEETIKNGEQARAELAAHVLIATYKHGIQKPSDSLISSLLKSTEANKLCILAELLRVFELDAYTEKLSDFLRTYIELVHDTYSREAWTVLSQALKRFDKTLYNRQFSLAHYKFLRFNSETAKPFMYPLLPLHNEVYLSDRDYDGLLESNDKECWLAAIWMLSLKGAGTTQDASRNDDPVSLSQAAKAGLRSLVQSGLDTREKWRFCNAIIKANLFEFLHWIEQVLKNRDGTDAVINMNDPNHGPYDEPQGALFLRAYGYLVRMREESTQGNESANERAFLRQQWIEYVRRGDNGGVAGAAIGRGYLGEWKPILSILSPEEPWLLDAGVNVMRHWVKEADSLMDAVKYIEGRLDAEQKLSETVKDALKRAGIEAERKLAIFEREYI